MGSKAPLRDVIGGLPAHTPSKFGPKKYSADNTAKPRDGKATLSPNKSYASLVEIEDKFGCNHP